MSRSLKIICHTSASDKCSADVRGGVVSARGARRRPSRHGSSRLCAPLVYATMFRARVFPRRVGTKLALGTRHVSIVVFFGMFHAVRTEAFDLAFPSTLSLGAYHTCAVLDGSNRTPPSTRTTFGAGARTITGSSAAGTPRTEKTREPCSSTRACGACIWGCITPTRCLKTTR